jgi:transcriptional regulator with XRE-family HTH domain
VEIVWNRNKYFALPLCAEIREALSVPKPSSFMNDLERAICARFASFRKDLGWDQADVAHALEITRDQVAGIENCRTPLRYKIASSYCAIMQVSQRWLAEGLGPKRLYFDVRSSLARQIPPEMLFSAAYAHFLKPTIDIGLAETLSYFSQADSAEAFQEMYAVVRPFVHGSWETAFALSAARIKQLYSKLPPHLLQTAVDDLRRFSELFLRNHKTEISRQQQSRLVPNEEEKEFAEKLGLTDFTLKSKSSPVNLISLLKRVKNATRARGSKSDLAAHLGVSPSRVTEWLKQIKEPSGSTTLALLEWVERKEAHKPQPQKNSGDAIEHHQSEDPKKESVMKTSIKSSPP